MLTKSESNQIWAVSEILDLYVHHLNFGVDKKTLYSEVPKMKMKLWQEAESD